MLVWGGSVNNNSGGRYNPATDSWATIGTTNLFLPRSFFSVVWTGTEMIVWGGSNNFGYTNTGGRYNPTTNTWSSMTLTNAPTARGSHSAVWTGSEMIIWGGSSASGVLNTGGKYDPVTDTWTPISSVNVPARSDNIAVWTGTSMIVWGGRDAQSTLQNTGARYDLATDTWTPTSTVNAPAARVAHSGVWTGSEMIVWGGYIGGNTIDGKTNTGGRYNPTTDTWLATSMVDAPTPRFQYGAVWTGSEMIVWGGESPQRLENIGGRYNPTTDTWIGTCDQNAPSVRVSPSAVWTGTQMVIWGGATFGFTPLITGGRYSVPPPPAPSVQFSSSAYSIEEGGSLTVTVTRTGNPALPLTVDYRTTDTDNFTVNCAAKNGAAFARCDFATVVGTFKFGAGEISKTFKVPIINDSYAEGNETFNLVLSNPGGATLGPTSTATVTITDNETSDAANPVMQTNATGVSFFVRQHYLDFLGREPEPGEPWSNLLRNCADQFNTNASSPAAGCDRITISGSFFGSPEFRDKGIYVIDFYRVAFGRLPLYSDFVHDVASVTGATADETNEKRAAFAANFAQSRDFTRIYDLMGHDFFVYTLLSGGGYYNLTSITTRDPAHPDTGAKVTLTREDLTNRLYAGTLTRAQVLRTIVQSDEITLDKEALNAFVASQYYGYLRRTPDTVGFNNWVDYLRHNPNDFRTMVNGFVNSPEYRLRFGPP